MMWVILLFNIAAVLYVVLIGHALWKWHFPHDVQGIDSSPGRVTVAVIARNEEDAIESCLRSILAQHYPADQMEIVVVNDHSTDHTEALAKSILGERGRVLSLHDYPEYIHAPAFKKSAIALVVAQTDTPWVLMTDADCVHPPSWVRTMMQHTAGQKSVFVAGPVLMRKSTSALTRMQEMEQLTLMMMTRSGITSRLYPMANGANMLFTREAFHAVDGYAGNLQWASGDDMFLVEKMMLQFPGQVSFCKSKDAAVETNAFDDWDDLLAQRVRWSQKNKAMRHSLLRHIWTFVGIYHVMLLLSMIVFFLMYWIPWIPVLMVLTKLLVDFLVFFTMCRHFGRTYLLSSFFTLQWYYREYVFRMAMAMISSKSYRWKERLVEVSP